MREKKLSIFVPRKDKCDLCSSYEMGNIDENVMAEHLAFKNRAREEKNLDKQLAINEIKFKKNIIRLQFIAVSVAIHIVVNCSAPCVH